MKRDRLKADASGIGTTGVEGTADLPGAEWSFYVHSRAEARWWLVLLLLITALLASVYPILGEPAYRGSADLHSGMAMTGALFGLVAGVALVVRFSAFGTRFHLLVGLAFLVGGAADFVYGLVSFRDLSALPTAPLTMPGLRTWPVGPLVLGTILLAAALVPARMRRSRNPKMETVWVLLLVLAATLTVSVAASRISLQELVLPERFISRPLDFASAVVFFLAFIAFVALYLRERQMLTWWVALSLGVNTIGQVLMSLSRGLYDPLFDVAHLYRVVGYMVPLLGLSLCQIAVIRERKRAEEALQESEARYRAMVENQVEAVCRWLPDTTLTYVNEGYCRSFGRRREELLGHKFISLLPESARDAFMARVDSLVANPRVIATKHQAIAADGSIRWQEWSRCPIFDEQGRLVEFQSVGRDITERKQAEDKLRKAMEELERSNTDLAQFAYVASHDLQDPLRSITGYLRLLEQHHGDRLGPDADRFITRAVAGADRMRRLIHDLLLYSRVDTRGKPLEPTACERILSEALRNLKAAVEENHALVTHDPLPTVVADRTQLTQLFQNLLSNAVKFRGDAAPTIHVRAEGKEDEWLFSVRDNGIGIEPRLSDHIFGVFEHLHTRAEYPGTGIGLAICRKIVERHGGRIWVESEPGNGATFYFTMPHSPGQG